MAELGSRSALMLLATLFACDSSTEKSNYATTTLETLNRSAVEKTRQDMLAIGTAVGAAATETGEPVQASSLADLKAILVPRHIRRLPELDAWGMPFEFAGDSSGWELRSSGADHHHDTDDDIVLADGEITLPKGFR